jgi:hypothetical protein
MSSNINTRIPKSRYAKSRFNLSRQIKVESGPLIQSMSEFRGSRVGDVKVILTQESRNRDMRNRDLI